MDFTHSEDRRMLADTVRRYLADRYPIAVRNAAAYGEAGHDPAQWRALAELGVTGALFDEAAGGFGGAGFDIMVVFEALGRGLVPEPFLGTLMAGTALARAGGQEDVLAGIVAGETLATFALAEPGRAHDPETVEARAVRDGDGWRLTGAKAVVPFADAADVIVVAAQGPDGIGLWHVARNAAGLAIRGYPLIEGGRAGEVTLDGTPATLIAIDGADALAAVLDAGLLALSAEALGIMDVLRDQTLDYLRTRQQFGTVIGKFQALQHRMATVLIEIEQMRSAVIAAADALGRDGGRRLAAAAKHCAGRIGRLVAEEAIQLHGGIAMTWALPLSHYAKRLTMIDHQLGDEDHHLARYTALGSGR